MIKLLTTILLLSLVSPVALGQDSHEDILHLHCVLDAPTRLLSPEGAASGGIIRPILLTSESYEQARASNMIESILYNFPGNSQWNFYRFLTLEEVFPQFYEGDFTSIEERKAELDDPPEITILGERVVGTSYDYYYLRNTYTTDQRDEYEINRLDGTFRQRRAGEYNTFSGKCSQVSHSEAEALFDDYIARIKAYAEERPPQLF